MSTLATYVSPTLPFGDVGAYPTFGGRARPELDQPDRAARTLVGHVRRRRDIEVKAADGRDELFGAFQLVYDAYLRSGLTKPNAYGLRVTPYHLLPTTEVFVALDRRKVICTVSLVRDGELGLPMEVVYDAEVAWRRIRGISLGEVSCLGDQGRAAGHSFPVVMQLMGLMAQCAERRGVDQLLIAVHPKHAKFYQRFAAFEPIGEEKTYETVCDKPAVAMALDLNRAPIDHPHLYKAFCGKRYPDEVLEYRPMPDELRSELSFVVDETSAQTGFSKLELLAAI